MQRVHLPEELRSCAEIWRLDLDIDGAIGDSDWSLLDADERQHALRFHKLGDRVRYSATRAALRRLLGDRLRQPPQALQFGVDTWGKPRLERPWNTAGIATFNVSHSGEHALIALASGGAIGIDIERCDPTLDTAALEGEVFSAYELKLCAELQLGFFERWVVKEAVLKAVGVGVAEYLQQLSVERLPVEKSSAEILSAEKLRSGGKFSHAVMQRYGLRYAQPEWPVLKAWRLAAPAGYTAAVACEVDIQDSLQA